MLAINKQDDWDAFLDQMDTKNGSVYRLNKCLLNKRTAVHPLNSLNSLAFSANDKPELFADSLESQFTLNPGLEIKEVVTTALHISAILVNRPKIIIFPSTMQSIIKKTTSEKGPRWGYYYKYYYNVPTSSQKSWTNQHLKRMPKAVLLSWRMEEGPP